MITEVCQIDLKVVFTIPSISIDKHDCMLSIWLHWIGMHEELQGNAFINVKYSKVHIFPYKSIVLFNPFTGELKKKKNILGFALFLLINQSGKKVPSNL